MYKVQSIVEEKYPDKELFALADVRSCDIEDYGNILGTLAIFKSKEGHMDIENSLLYDLKYNEQPAPLHKKICLNIWLGVYWEDYNE